MLDLKQAVKEINEILENKRKELQLTFEEEGHIYHMLDRNGILRSDFPSVSTVIKSFCTEFDAEGKSLQMTNGDLDAQKVLLEQWAYSGEYASQKGSYVHYELEKYILNKNKINKLVRKPIFTIDAQQTIDGNNMILAGKNFLDLMEERGCVLLETEVVLGSNEVELEYVGQADDFWLCYGKDKKTISFIVTDHKSNKIKNLEPQRYNGMLNFPFETEIDYAKTHYFMQLPFYARLFKNMLIGSKYEDIPLLGCIVDSLRDNGSFEEYRVPMNFINGIMKMNVKSYLN